MAADPFSNVAGVPVAVLGLLAYLLLAFMAVLRAWGVSPHRLSIAGLAVAGFGSLASATLLYRSLTVIHAVCPWCVASGALMAALFVVHLLLVRATYQELWLPRARWDMPVGLALSMAALGGALYTPKHMGQPVLGDLDAVRKTPEAVLIPAGSHMLGNPQARLTIVEFSDLACPTCRQMHARLEKFVAHSAGAVRLVFRHLPLVGVPGHEQSRWLATLAEMCGTSKSFWEFVDSAYSGPISSSDKERLRALESMVGNPSDPAALRKASETVARDVSLARSLKIDNTPTYIILSKGTPPAIATSTDLVNVLSAPRYQEILGRG